MFETKYGYFSEDQNEYIIKTPKTPRPWVNIISNGDYGVAVSQNGSGYSWKTHASLNRINRWEQDIIKDEWGKYFYIKNNENDELFTPTFKPMCKKNIDYKIIHGFGYSKFLAENKDLKTELTLTVPKDSSLEIWMLKIKNKTKNKLNLSVFSYLEWNLGTAPDWHREFHKTFIDTYFMNDVIKAEKRMWDIPNENGEHWNRNWEYTAFNSVNEKTSSATSCKEDFLGNFGSVSNPEGLKNKKLNNIFGKYQDSIASLHNEMIIDSDEEKILIYTIGLVEKNDTKEIDNIKKIYSTEKSVLNEIEKNKKMWKDIFEKNMVETPDIGFNLMNNKWLKYQAISGRLWGRTGYYQTGGAFGFRDQLQDSQIFLYVDPNKTAEQIKLHAKHQFIDGSVYHWWHPISEIGLKNNISDNRLWLAFITLRYLKETNNFNFLNEMVPYIDYEDESIYDHCIKAIKYNLSKLSSRGLPLIGSGDWNDGMSAVGTDGKGESIWLGHFLYGILNDFSYICNKQKDYENEDLFKKEALKLKKSINKYAWDGEWFIRAFKDDGKSIGSSKCSEGKIFLNAQTWAILNNSTTEERKEKAYESLKKYLFKEFGPLLFQPAYSKPDKEIGYLSRYAPGVRENGGLYTHAGTWGVLAACKMNDENSYKIYKSFMPVYRGMNPDKYFTEPYVTPGNVDGPDSPNFGRGGWSWYTGSASWYFITGMEGILGITPEWNGLKISPVMPKEWDKVFVKRYFRNCLYNINFIRSKNKKIIVNENEIDGNIINNENNEKTLNIFVYF